MKRLVQEVLETRKIQVIEVASKNYYFWGKFLWYIDEEVLIVFVLLCGVV